LVLLVVLAAAAAPAGASDPARDSSVVTLLHARDYRPLFYVDEAGHSRGLLVDYWRLWSKKTGVPVRFEADTWANCVDRVRTEPRSVIPGIFYTPERDGFLDFSQSFMEIKTSLITRQSTGIKDLATIGSHPVGVTRGDRSVEYLADFYPAVNLREYPDFESLVTAAATGEIDAFVMDMPVGQYFLMKLKAEKAFDVTQTLYVGKFCAAVRQGEHALLRDLSTGIEQINEDEIEDLFIHWFPRSGIMPEWVHRYWLRTTVVMAALFLVIHIISLRIRVRRRTRELQATEAKYRLLIENAYEGIAVARGPRFLFVNSSMTRMSGYSRDELLKMNRAELVHPDDMPRIHERFRRQMNGERVSPTQSFRVKSATGQIRWIHSSAVPIEWEGGPADLEFITDITDLKEAEEALQKERNFMSAVLDTAGAMVIVFDADGRIVRFNAECEKVSGARCREVIGKPFWDFFIIPEEVAMIRERFKRLAAGEPIVNGENHWRSHDDTLRLISWANTALLDKDNNVEFIIAIGIDITDMRSTQEALRLSEQRFRRLVENATDVIYALTPDGTLTYLSPQFTAATGYEVSEFLGDSIDRIIHPDDRTEYRKWIAAGMPKPHDEHDGEYLYRLKTKSGRWKWFTSNASVIRNDDGGVIEAIGVANDVTELREAFESLEKANRELRDTQTQLVQTEKMASLGMLVAGVAHEINTPFGAVSSMHDTQKRAAAKILAIFESEATELSRSHPTLTRALKVMMDANDVIDSGIERVSNIVRRLRSFARLDEADVKTASINEGIEDTLTLIHHELKHNITVVRNFGMIPPVRCYPGRLNQVFLNLLVNARQAIKGKGTITIGTSMQNGLVCITFEDDGAGIRPENLKRIFDPGFTTKGVGVGTGLGLSICYQIIQDHNGHIYAESEVGKGTKFTIILPTDLPDDNNRTG